MKRTLFAIFLAAALLSAAGCSGSSDTSDDVENGTVDEVTGTGAGESYPNSSVTSLAEYIGVEVSTYDTEVTDDDLQEEIEYILEDYAESYESDKTVVEDGDTVNIDYTGYLDGEAFDGGSSEDYELEIGSDSFIDGFEDGLIGAEVGSTVSLDLTFPDEYYSEDLAGEDVVFEVTVNYIVEYDIPEWTDEFVSENLGYDTAAEYEEVLLEELIEYAEESAEEEQEYEALTTIIENSEFDIDEDDVQGILDEQIEYYELYASYYGVELEEFVTYFGFEDLDEFEDYMYDYAVFQLQCELVVEAIALAEGIQITEEEYDEGLEELAEYYEEDAEDLEDTYGTTAIIYSIIYDKTIDYIVENAVVTED